ncbi:MAG: DUF411 domain-containing protein [Alphaproteobacteria bacterium]|jgi:hypothetical protein|nr:DUF411 domain-containing protein [Alphaproteobacteria bacterium]MBM3951280.1 DUF411 domain-containing protein [Rhodospirillales bacterium]
MRLSVFAALAALVISLASPARAAEEAVVYKDPNCGCCGDYAKVLESEGFRVRVKETTALDALRRMAGVPDKLASCHTITIGKYVVEGHVPVAAVKKLLAEKPDIRGIALPGMPQGSPGMTGVKEGPFVVYEIGSAGQPKVFMTE